MSEWKHLEVIIDDKHSNKFILEFLAIFPKIAYFDRVTCDNGFKLRLHINIINDAVKKQVNEFQQYHRAMEINDYDIAGDISELFFGSAAEKIYLKASLDSMNCVSSLIQSKESGHTSMSDLAFSIMSLYVLHPKCKSVFFSKKHNDSVPFSFLSFRSHSDGYFIRMEQEDKYRQKVEALYQDNKLKYIERFNQLKSAYQNGGLDEGINQWLKLIDELFAIIEQAVETKQVDFLKDGPGYIANSYKVSDENFHEKTKGKVIFYRYIRNNKDMKVLRLITGIMYLTLHRLGLSYLERNCLCYIISRTVEDAYNTNVDKAIKAVNSSIVKYYLKRILTLRFAA